MNISSFNQIPARPIENCWIPLNISDIRLAGLMKFVNVVLVISSNVFMAKKDDEV
jgi:hypothetical protein